MNSIRRTAIYGLIISAILYGFLNNLNAQSYTDASSISGVNVLHDGDAIFEPIVPMGSGACWFDYNKDGWLDLYVTLRTQPNHFYQNQGDGTFVEVAALLGIDDPTGDGAGVSSADINNDGWPDLFLANNRDKRLFLNNAGLGFTDITQSAFGSLMPTGESRGVTASWGDYDNDGYLDLYIAQHDNPNNQPITSTEQDFLFYNNGDNTFSDVSLTSLRLDTVAGWSFIGGWTDFDKDGDQDILLVTDCDSFTIVDAYPIQIFRNDGGNDPLNWNFTEVAIASGMNDCRNGMGLALGDINRDGWMDAFYTNIGQIVLWENNAGIFTNITSAAGMDNYPADDVQFSWGCSMFDYDLDQDLDIAVSLGHLILSGSAYPHQNLFFENDGTGFFTEIGNSINMAHTDRTRTMAYADYDNDGDIDVFQINFNEECRLLRNDVNNGNNWLKIRTQGTLSNWNGIGTKIKVSTANGVVQYYEIKSGSNKGAGDTQYALFGLDSNTMVANIELEWPSGLIESYNNLAANQFLEIIEGLPLLDMDGDGYVSSVDCDDNNANAYPGNVEICDGIDNNCSGLIDAQDPLVQGTIYYSDDDQDGFGDASNASCSFQTGYVLVAGDCNDSNSSIYPGAHEVCDGIDSDCDGFIDNGCLVPHSSVAREWNEQLLNSIRKDLARPTVHARNLWHSSVAMYDLWTVNDTISEPYFLGEVIEGFSFDFAGIQLPVDISQARNEAISYCMYRLLRHRFQNNTNWQELYASYDTLMYGLGYDISFTSMDYSNGDYRALGNYFADKIIQFGLQDNSNEQNDYNNLFYHPVNDSLVMDLPGNSTITDYNRWQPLSLDTFIDQSGNLGSSPSPPFLSPEWGRVHAFALQDGDKNTYQRDGFDYEVYHDPSAPPYHSLNGQGTFGHYEWGFSLVSTWSAHLDPTDGVMWDISPGSIGNIQSYPNDFNQYASFFDKINGGDPSIGHTINPHTGMPYVSQMVPRGDYARVLAEFWADGPESETPPGHWFTILNYVNDHPAFEKKFEGNGPILDDLEWDVKSYFILGGAVHDAAVAAWGVKGWYDYIRPVSAIRAMADLGQSTNNLIPSYHPGGLKLIPGLIELVYSGDPLEGDMGENIGKIKLYAWKGPDYINDPATDNAGVDWILAENWWPYQRPTFVTPPFAGYVSGHSTFSRSAAVVMESMTGDAFFPGGMGEFIAPRNEFLVFEEGPSVDVILQWATYKDASDQCSLSRIWGGIHPPVDDIPGRAIGQDVGTDAFALAREYILGSKCYTYLSIDIDPINKHYYQSRIIDADGVKRNNSNPQHLIFNGTNEINLLPGFEIELGGAFDAQIGPCN